jgi:hypothetical protein
MFLLLLALALQSPQSVALKRFEVLRVSAGDMERLPASLRPIFVDPTPDAEPVDSLDQATTRAGFTPRFPKSANKPQLGVIDPVRAEARIAVADLNAALRDAKATNVAVPQEWDGIAITIEQGRGILADYGDFLITQAPPLTFNAPSGFPLDQFIEVLFRVVGMNAPDARTLRQKFTANPAAFFPIPSRYDMDIHEVRLNSGSGLLLQNAGKVGELALAWATADRTYFVTGLLTEAQAIEVANSIQ